MGLAVVDREAVGEPEGEEPEVGVVDWVAGTEGVELGLPDLLPVPVELPDLLPERLTVGVPVGHLLGVALDEGVGEVEGVLEGDAPEEIVAVGVEGAEGLFEVVPVALLVPLLVLLVVGDML